MIAAGTPAPDFEAPDSTGGTLRLSSLRGGPVVLYFFPKAFTGGCTVETRQFAELAPSLAGRGVRIVGISIDPPDVQARFSATCATGFPFVSDVSRSISRAYGVLSLLGVSKRATFFLDADGIVRDVVVSLLPGPHLARTRALYPREAPTDRP